MWRIQNHFKVRRAFLPSSKEVEAAVFQEKTSEREALVRAREKHVQGREASILCLSWLSADTAHYPMSFSEQKRDNVQTKEKKTGES